VGISQGDRRRLRQLRERFLEHRRVGVYCAVALIPAKYTIPDDNPVTPLEGFANVFRNRIIPSISGSSVFSAPNPKDPDATERLTIAANAEWIEMLYVDGLYSTLTAFSELGNDAWALLPLDLRKRKAVLLDHCKLSHIRYRYVLWSQIVFNVLSGSDDAIEFSEALAKDGIPRAAWLTENAFLASADAIGIILEDSKESSATGDTKSESQARISVLPKLPADKEFIEICLDRQKLFASGRSSPEKEARKYVENHQFRNEAERKRRVNALRQQWYRHVRNHRKL